MSAKEPGRASLEKTRDAIHEKLKAGHPPSGVTGVKGLVGAIAAAARSRGLNRKTVGAQFGPNGWVPERYPDLTPDWSLYTPVEPEGEEVPSPQETKRRRAVQEQDRLRAQLAVTKRETRLLRQENVGLANWRETVLNMPKAERPIVRPQAPGAKDKGAYTVLLDLSDLHMGEVVERDEVDGLNVYNKDVCIERLWRFFHRAERLIPLQCEGRKPERIILMLHGDLYSGWIHEELQKTNDVQGLPGVRLLIENLAGGIKFLLGAFKAPIEIHSVPGNHSRDSRKKESKGAIKNNLDTLTATLLEWRFEKTVRLKFYQPVSIDAAFSVYGRSFLLTHGDRIGSGGGTGFIGPVATMAKGARKVIQDYAARGTLIDMVFFAHFHTTIRHPLFLGNGSMVGWGQYARDLRADKEPPQQNLITVHSRKGIVDVSPVVVGVESEGTLCRGFS